MQKITEIRETKYRTTYVRDALGNRIQKKVPFEGLRKVQVVSGGRRFAHFFFDLVVVHIIWIIFNYLLSFLFVLMSANAVDALAIALFANLLYFLNYPLYYTLFEHFSQKTPGKFITQTRVIDIYGNKPSFGTLMLRNIIRLVPFEIFSCLSERGWHDRWSETFVVKDEEAKKIKEAMEKLADKTKKNANITP